MTLKRIKLNNMNKEYIKWHLSNSKLITNTQINGFKRILKLSPTQNTRHFLWSFAIAVEFDSLNDGKAPRHKESQCHHVLVVFLSLIHLSLPFYFILFFSFAIVRFQYSVFVKFLVNQFTLELDYYSILFEILRNSSLNRFSFRSFIIVVIRQRVLMPDSQVNFCRIVCVTLLFTSTSTSRQQLQFIVHSVYINICGLPNEDKQ